MQQASAAVEGALKDARPAAEIEALVGALDQVSSELISALRAALPLLATCLLTDEEMASDWSKLEDPIRDAMEAEIAADEARPATAVSADEARGVVVRRLTDGLEEGRVRHTQIIPDARDRWSTRLR